MAKHHPDLIMCRKQPGIAIGKLCDKCDGRCPICDSYVKPDTLVRICDECDYGVNHDRCIICGAKGSSDAYYCRECVLQEKDRDGCPKIVNLGQARTDYFYEQKKYHLILVSLSMINEDIRISIVSNLQKEVRLLKVLIDNSSQILTRFESEFHRKNLCDNKETIRSIYDSLIHTLDRIRGKLKDFEGKSEEIKDDESKFDELKMREMEYNSIFKSYVNVHNKANKMIEIYKEDIGKDTDGGIKRRIISNNVGNKYSKCNKKCEQEYRSDLIGKLEKSVDELCNVFDQIKEKVEVKNQLQSQIYEKEVVDNTDTIKDNLEDNNQKRNKTTVCLSVIIILLIIIILIVIGVFVFEMITKFFQNMLNI